VKKKKKNGKKKGRRVFANARENGGEKRNRLNVSRIFAPEWSISATDAASEVMFDDARKKHWHK
jgi:hypothetical protein